mmetsp:Transcript_22943/g.52589  ORF Transcript_22943/g.52589 Transcript_22943/m.52589 type:complete len:293 (+) Transcript_22943:82-960(+)
MGSGTSQVCALGTEPRGGCLPECQRGVKAQPICDCLVQPGADPDLVLLAEAQHGATGRPAAHSAMEPTRVALTEEEEIEEEFHYRMPGDLSRYAVRQAMVSNPDWAAELRGVSSEVVRARIDCMLREFRERLKVGIEVKAGDAVVTLVYDAALTCLDIPEHGVLYPLATLTECAYLPHSGGTSDAGFDLRLPFNDSEAITLTLPTARERAALALTLQELAMEAQSDKWHQDLGEDSEEAMDETDSLDAAPSYSKKQEMIFRAGTEQSDRSTKASSGHSAVEQMHSCEVLASL